MEKFIKEKEEYYKKLEEHKSVAVKLAKSNNDPMMLRILLLPDNKKDLIKANAFLDYAIDLENLYNNAILGRVTQIEKEDNIFVEFIILMNRLVQEGKIEKELFEEMSKIAISRGYSEAEYMAELLFNAVLIPFSDDYDFYLKQVAESCGINLKGELEAMIFRAMFKQISRTIPKLKAENDEKKFTEFANYFHKRCSESIIIRGDNTTDKIVRRLIKKLPYED